MGVFAPTAHRTRLRTERSLFNVNATDSTHHGLDFLLVFDWRMVRSSNHHRHSGRSDRVVARDFGRGLDVCARERDLVGSSSTEISIPWTPNKANVNTYVG